jgi:hypothetical protein
MAMLIPVIIHWVILVFLLLTDGFISYDKVTRVTDCFSFLKLWDISKFR